jgi:hypothetical protein
VGDDCDIAQVISGGLSHRNILIVSAPNKVALFEYLVFEYLGGADMHL